MLASAALGTEADADCEAAEREVQGMRAWQVLQGWFTSERCLFVHRLATRQAQCSTPERCWQRPTQCLPGRESDAHARTQSKLRAGQCIVSQPEH